MRHLLLSILAVATIAVAPLAAAEGAAAEAKVANTVCVCGQPVGADAPTVDIKVGEGDKAKAHTVAVCCDKCGDKVKAMDPKEAWKAVKAHNKTDKGEKPAN